MGICYDYKEERDIQSSNVYSAQIDPKIGINEDQHSFILENDEKQSGENFLFYLSNYASAERILRRSKIPLSLSKTQQKIIEDHFQQIDQFINKLSYIQDVIESFRFQLFKVQLFTIKQMKKAVFKIKVDEYDQKKIEGTVIKGCWKSTISQNEVYFSLKPNERVKKIHLSFDKIYCNILLDNMIAQHPLVVTQVSNLHMEGAIGYVGRAFFRFEVLDNFYKQKSDTIQFLHNRKVGIMKFLDPHKKIQYSLQNSISNNSSMTERSAMK